MNKNNLLESVAPIEKNELGQLKGGFSMYTVLPIEPLQNSVSVTVNEGTCSCSCVISPQPNE